MSLYFDKPSNKVDKFFQAFGREKKVTPAPEWEDLLRTEFREELKLMRQIKSVNLNNLGDYFACQTIAVDYLLTCLKLGQTIIPTTLPQSSLENSINIQTIDSKPHFVRKNQEWGTVWSTYRALTLAGISHRAIQNGTVVNKGKTLEYFDLVVGADCLVKFAKFIEQNNINAIPSEVDKIKVQELLAIVEELNLSVSSLISFVNQCKGIQIFYDNSPKFHEFITQNNPKEIDDKALAFDTPIPFKFVSGILPLGQLEKNLLSH